MSKLYVGNLSFDTGEDDLRELFEQSGTVTDVFIAKDKFSGRSRGFGFVTMGSAEEAQNAISAVNGQNIGGRDLTVNEARPKEDRPARSFGGGGGGGGGGDRGRGRGFGGGGGGGGGGGRDRDRGGRGRY